MPGTAPTAAMEGIDSGNSVGSLLLLDKSELCFETQLGEACRLIGVDLLSFHEEYEIYRSISPKEKFQDSINGPRYEWTLKWVLSKISLDVHLGCPCLVPKTWVLLLFLMTKIDPVKIAQILADKRYLGAIQRTLGWLRRDMGGRELFADVSFSDSSSEEGRSSKKRKRGQTGSKRLGPDQAPFELLTALVLPICQTLNQAQYLMKSESEVIHIVEQFKNSLRCGAEEAANIVSDALYLQEIICFNISICDITNDEMRVTCRQWKFWGPLSCVGTYIDFWSLRFPASVDVSHSNFVSLEENIII